MKQNLLSFFVLQLSCQQGIELKKQAISNRQEKKKQYKSYIVVLFSRRNNIFVKNICFAICG